MAFVCSFVDVKGSEVAGDGTMMAFVGTLVAPERREMTSKGKGMVIPRRLVSTECNSAALASGMVDDEVLLVARDGCGEAGDGYAMGIVSSRRLFDGMPL